VTEFYWRQSVFVVMFALGLGTITYPGAAIENGWGLGRWARDSNNAPHVVAFASVIVALLLTLFKLGWIYLLVTVLGGYALMAVLLSTLKTKFQLVGLSLFVITPLAIALIAFE
jgi:hypothetical protein